ncbi:MAG TPA: hypothetical protein IAB13_04655 [Candidatus Avanaerovorax faecigallinarum]|nr:hypothetical protein [Candidatus Avanaerovorax faecigallinarum]
MYDLIHVFLHPGIVLILTGAVIALLPKAASRYLLPLGALAALAALLGTDKSLSIEAPFVGELKLSLFVCDEISWFFGLVFAVIGVIGSVYSMDKGRRGEKAASAVYAGSALMTVFAGNMLTFIIFWEVMAIASIYMVFQGNGPDARRSSYRYMVMHLFGGNMLLAGVMLLPGGITAAVGPVTDTDSLAYWLMFIGTGVNCALPPFHTWVADSYPQATPESQLFMGSYTTKVAVYAMIRFFAGTEWLVIFAAVTAVLAACMALIENDLRKLLSYHIVSQVAMMVAGLAAGGDVGAAGAAMHAAFNILYKGVLLMAAGNIFTARGLRYITDMGGLARKMPVTAVCAFIASFAIAGVPYFSGFASKALIMDALHAGGFNMSYILVTMAGVGTWLSITMKINYFVFIKKPERELPAEDGPGRVPAYKVLAMAAATVLVVITGIRPEICYDMLSMDPPHLFVADHVLEYIGLFAGATVPFVLLRTFMAPHEGINLDVDRFYRITLYRGIFALSDVVHLFFAKYAVIFDNFYRSVGDALRSPGRVFGLRTTDSKEENARSIGEMVHVMAILCVIALITILVMD